MSEMPPSTPPPMGSYTPPPPAGGGYTPPPSGSSDRQLMLALCYLFFLGLIPLLTRKEDRDIQWHAKNGLGLFLVYLIFQVLLVVIQWVIPASGCGVGALMSVLGCVVFLGYLAAVIMGIMKALKGDRLRLPAISDFADKS